MTRKCNEKLIHTLVSGTTFIQPIQVYDCHLTGKPTSTVVEKDCIVLQTRWLRDASKDYCEIDIENHNTGTLFIYEYEEEKIDNGDWYANGNTRYTPTYNTSICPLFTHVYETRWVRNPNLDYCEKNGNDNTGTRLEYSYEEERVDGGNWYTTGNTRYLPTYNTTLCPLPIPPPTIPYRIAMYVGKVYDSSNEVNVPYSTNTIHLNTTVVTGYNYLFLSLPADRSFTVYDGTGVDLTSLFIFVADDVRPDFKDNKIYRKNPKFSSVAPVPFTLLIH